MLTILILALGPAASLPDGGEPVLLPAVCFADGTDGAYREQVHEALGAPPEYYLNNRWSGAPGSPRTVTWSLIPDGVEVPSAGPWDNGGNGAPNELFARMDDLFGGDRALWIQRIQESFDRWGEISGLAFVRITEEGADWDDGAGWSATGSATRGDIRIAMRPIDGVSGVLAWNNYPGGGAGGNMLLDRAESFENAGSQHRYFRNTLMHEVGHGVGIQHVCSNNSQQLMEPLISAGFDGPRQDDLRAVQRHYGDVFEPNDASGAATDLGVLATELVLGELPPPQTGLNGSGTALLGLELDDGTDLYRFTVQSSSRVSVTLTPVGTTYNDAEQVAGSCPAGGMQTNAAAAADLGVQVLDLDGASVLGTAADQPAGAVETLTGVELDPPGDYFVRVFEQGTPSGVQLYRFTLTAEPFSPSFCDASDGSLALCPCGNPGTPGTGCDLSQGTGGVSLLVLGQETTPSNRVTLRGAGYPPSSMPTAVVIRSGSLEAAPVAFGDGLRCIGVPLVRLAATTALFGFSDHTLGHGQAAGSGEFYYQLWFRNTPALFCTPDAFNLSNGRSLTW